MSFWDHLEELRGRLRRVIESLIVILIVVLIVPGNPGAILANPTSILNGSFLANTLLSMFLTRIVTDILPKGWVLIAAGGLGEALEIYFVGGIVLALAIDIPIIAYETFKFVDPALKENERRLVYPFLISSSLLFLVGLIFGYYVLARFLIFALTPFFQATQISFSVDAASFYFVVFVVIISSGISFTTPAFVYSLIKLRIVDADFFSKNRVLIWFGTWIVTALFLTPDGGPLLDLALFVPIITLLELAVFLGGRGRPKGMPKEIPREAKCRFCSAKIPENTFFCRRCGRAQR